MIDLYQHEQSKFMDAGLQLRLPVDLVPKGQYSRHNNLVATTEGELRTRAGLTPILNVSANPIHSLFRLNQQSSSNVPTQRIIGSGVYLWSQVIPSTTIDQILIANGSNFDGGPLSIIDFRFDFDPNSWALIANANGMAKVRVHNPASTGAVQYTIASTEVVVKHITSGGTVFVTNVLRITTTTNNNVQIGSQATLNGLTTHLEYNGFSGTVANIVSPTVFEFGNDSGITAYGSTPDTGTASVLLSPKASYLAWVLGQRAPTTAVTASAGGAGNLNNGSGPGYDWRSTFVNSTVNSESNPSPIQGVIGQQRPTVNINPDSNIIPNLTVSVDSKTKPWLTTGGINLAFQYGDGTGSAPVVVPATLVPGTLITVSYLSGTVQCSDARPRVTGAGQTNFITGTTLGSTGNRFPTFYMAGSNLGLGGLCGAFCDNTGQVIQPLSIGNGGTFLVPLGASRLQLGIDDDRFDDNNGSFAVSVTGVPTTGCANPGNAYDNDSTTFAEFVGGAGGTANAQTCNFKGWAGIGTVLGISLNVDSAVSLVGSGTPGTVEVTLQYSIDNGVTWLTLYQTSSDRARRIDKVNFAVAVDISQLQVRAIASGADTTIPIDLKIYEIYTETDNGAVTVLALANQQANLCVQAPQDPQQDTIRLYRRGGSVTIGWEKVGDFPISKLSQGPCGNGTLQIIDNIPDSELTDLLDLDNDMPVSGITATNTPLPAIWGPSNRRVLGCGDPSRPDAVYFSKPGNADSWPPQNWISVSSPSDPMQNGCIYNTRDFAFSYERMWELVEGLVPGVTISAFPTPTIRGLISRWGLCVYDKIYFVAKDGVYATTGGQESSIVENDIKPLFPTKDSPGRSVNGYEAVDMTQPNLIRLSAHNDEIYFTYAGVQSGTLQTLIFDVRKGRWRAANYTPAAHCYYSEPATTSSLLVGGGNGTYYQATPGIDDQANIPVSLRTGSHDQGMPLTQKEYGSVVLDIDPGGADSTHPVTVTPYINGEAIQESLIQVTGTGRQQVPLPLGDIFAYNLEFSIAWTKTQSNAFGNLIDPILYQYDILWRPEPTQLTHWEARENAYRMPGYFHVRDGWLGIRSNDIITLAFYADGASAPFYSVALGSTGNLRRRVYFSLPGGFKSKVLRVTCDSPSPFRLYVEDCEFRIKPWLGVMGYQRVPMVGGEGQQASGMWESNVLGGGL